VAWKGNDLKLNQVKFQDPATGTFLGSPSFVRLDNGDLLATHDYFGWGCPRNHEDEEHLTSVYRSADNGTTWINVTHIANAFWSTLFKHNGAVYLLGASQQYGSIVIRRTDDGGNTWTHPKDEKSGLLFRGGPFHESPNYHCAPVPVLLKHGRLYRAFEDCSPCEWPAGFQSCVISIDAKAELLDASNWRMSNKLAFDPAWLPQEWGTLTRAGWLEGNVVEAPDGQLWNVLRFNAQCESAPAGQIWDRACIVRVDDGGGVLSFDPASGFIDLPGGHTKFTIRQDAQIGLYLTLSNGNLNPATPTNRSVLSLHASEDLRAWRHVKVLLEDDSGLAPAESFENTGFQYVDWHFDGEDIVYLVRTAYDNADTFHNANRITFHRIEHYQSLFEA
jgi:hypothetical protein